MNSPNGSAPTAPTMSVRAPIPAAAMAWFAPFPPGCRANEVPISVSPGRGNRSAVTTRSTLIDPTTTTLPTAALIVGPNGHAKPRTESMTRSTSGRLSASNATFAVAASAGPRWAGASGPEAAQIAHRHPARVHPRQFHLDRGLDIADQLRRDIGNHRADVMDRGNRQAKDAVLPGEIEGHQIADDGGHLPPACPQPRHIVRIEPGPAGDVVADHADREAAAEHDRRRLGVAGDVELRHRRDVAEARRASHDRHFAHPPLQPGLPFQRHGEIRLRADQRDNQLAAVVRRKLDDQIDGVAVDRPAGRRRDVRPVQTGLAVNVPGMPRALDQRFGTSGRDRHVDPGEFQDRERIAGGVGKRIVAVDGRDRDKVEMSGREQDGHRIVMTGIAVDQDFCLLCHRTRRPCVSSI